MARDREIVHVEILLFGKPRGFLLGSPTIFAEGRWRGTDEPMPEAVVREETLEVHRAILSRGRTLAG